MPGSFERMPNPDYGRRPSFDHGLEHNVNSSSTMISINDRAFRYILRSKYDQAFLEFATTQSRQHCAYC